MASLTLFHPFIQQYGLPLQSNRNEAAGCCCATLCLHKSYRYELYGVALTFLPNRVRAILTFDNGAELRTVFCKRQSTLALETPSTPPRTDTTHAKHARERIPKRSLFPPSLHTWRRVEEHVKYVCSILYVYKYIAVSPRSEKTFHTISTQVATYLQWQCVYVYVYVSTIDDIDILLSCVVL